MISHNNIEKSFYKYIYENLEALYDYAVNYGEIRFESNPYDLWLSVVFEELGAGAKKFSPVRIDIMSRITNVAFQNDETTAIDRIREKLTKANILLYDFTSSPPVLVDDEKIIIKNNDGRFTIERVVLNNAGREELKENIRRSSVFLRLELLTDTIGGHFV